MKIIAAPFGLLLLAAGIALCADGDTPQSPPKAAAIPWPAGLPVYDHIVIVVEENKDFEQIIGDARAPYINQILRKQGATFTQMFGEEHYSEGNYFWLFSGSNQTWPAFVLHFSTSLIAALFFLSFASSSPESCHYLATSICQA